MRHETSAIHAGYDPDPTTKSVAVPIYQTVAYAFDSADHGAALFNLEAEGYRYSRIANPTPAGLGRRPAAPEGGAHPPRVNPGPAAPHYPDPHLMRPAAHTLHRPQPDRPPHPRCAPRP